MQTKVSRTSVNEASKELRCDALAIGQRAYRAFSHEAKNLFGMWQWSVEVRPRLRL